MSTQYTDEEALNLCINCGYYNTESQPYCLVCNLTMDHAYTYEPDNLPKCSGIRYRDFSATFKKKKDSVWSNINISRKGKGKIKKFQLLQTYFLPLLQQFKPEYYCKTSSINSTYKQNLRFQSRENINIHNQQRKYQTIKTEIQCITSEHTLKSLQLIFNDAYSFEPTIVYTTKNWMDKSKKKRNSKIETKKQILQNNNQPMYELMANMLVHGFGKYYLDVQNQMVPNDVNDIIQRYYGRYEDTFVDAVKLVKCTKNMISLEKYLQTNRNIFICISLGDYHEHCIIPIFNIKLKMDKIPL